MYKKPLWKSNLGSSMKDFVALKRINGFKYDQEEYELSRLDTFCNENKEFDLNFITRELVSVWSIQFPNEDKNKRNSRIYTMGIFSKYLNSIGIKSYIPKNNGSSTTPYVYVPSFEELQVFFTYVDNHQFKNKETYLIRVNLIYPILFRLLYCCGLRLSEACYLKRNLINLSTGTLNILQSKGMKDRIVYVSKDLCNECKEYDEKIDKLVPNREWFFVGKLIDKPIPKESIDNTFKIFWKNSFPSWSKKMPTPQTLRHAYVVRRMTLWISEGKDLNAMMPYLSRYLGHSSVNETYYYYHQLESIFPIIKKHDTRSSFIIPEVLPYEEYEE